jgi:hypothetical protein
VNGKGARIQEELTDAMACDALTTYLLSVRV